MIKHISKYENRGRDLKPNLPNLQLIDFSTTIASKWSESFYIKQKEDLNSNHIQYSFLDKCYQSGLFIIPFKHLS